MRKLLTATFVLAACTTAPPPAPAPQPAAAQPPVPAVHGFTLDEEARVLQLEDRREYDPAFVSAWAHNTNALHRARIALAMGRIGRATFADTNGNGVKDAGELQAGVAELIALAGDSDANVRANVAFAFGQIADPAATDALVGLAADRDADVASEAVEALSKLAPSVAFTRYTPFTTATEREGVRVRAIRFLFRFKSDEASAVAANALESTSAVVREAAAYTLSRRAYAPAREKLELLLTDPGTLTRSYAASALGRIASRESLPALADALRDAHPWVRTNAVTAIARIAAKDKQGLAMPDQRQLTLRVIGLTDDPDPGVRAASIDALGWLATSSELARKTLFDLVANGSRVSREIAAGQIAAHFTEPVPDLSPWAKVRVLENAATNANELRRKYATDPDPLVRATALSTIPDEDADAMIATIRAGLSDADPIVRANAIDRLSKSKSPDVAALRAAEERARTDSQDDARLSAIDALAKIDFPEREAYLRALVNDRDLMARRIAAEAIETQLKKPRPQYTPLPIDRPLNEYADIASWARTQHTASIHMTRGTIEIALLSNEAPMTAWNFASLAKRHYFDNTTFMRVVPNFVVQGGDPRNDMSGSPGYAIRDEINLQKYTRGAVGMALSGPDTGGSQFFITHSPQPHLDGGYTIFGRVYEGMNGVVDQTERGDKVETIAIDEHAPVTRAELAPIVTPPLPTEIGPITPARLITTVPEYADRKSKYEPDAAELQMIASAIKPGDHLDVFMGTWCPDSQREVPKLLKIVDVLRERYAKELPVSFVAVDRAKQKPTDLLRDRSIEKVATFIYVREGQELGRIVEKPQGLLEDDLLVLASK